jgi:hypothetical protein
MGAKDQLARSCEKLKSITGMRRITTFQSTTDRIDDGGPIRLWYYNIILSIMLQLPTVFSTVPCCTGL